jgi:DNA-directed RNA polymerase specialized sigma24 family protein
MDDVLEFCRRVLCSDELAAEAAAEARAEAAADRVAQLTAASQACRDRIEMITTADGTPPPASGNGASAVSVGTGSSLRQAVAAELAVANARLPERHREALALRELLRVSYDQLATVMGIEPAAVAPLLGRARLRLRAELRGPLPSDGDACDESDRALRILARRQDGEAVQDDEEQWIFDHLYECPSCERAHAAMLEAMVCYRGWRAEAPTR